MTPLVLRMITERFHRDVEGRPLREGRTPPEHLCPGELEYRTCPYAGSRRGKPMNAGALRQTGAHWAEIGDALGALRAGHDRARGTGAPGVMDVWRVSQLGSALPWFHLFRDGEVPAHAASLAKLTLGTGIWAQRMLVRMLAESWHPGELTSARILELAEASGTLLGEHEVCAGGDKMLLAFFDLLVGPCSAAPASDELLAFGACYASFKLVVWIYYLARRFLAADAGLTLDAPVEPPDFFVVEPACLAAIPPRQRAWWFHRLADLVVPFAPGGADRALAAQAHAIADAMGEPAAPAATFARLDAIFADVLAVTEAGLGGTGPVTREDRERIVAPPAFAARAA